MKCYEFYPNIDHRTIALMAATLLAAATLEDGEWSGSRYDASLGEALRVAELLYLKLEERRRLNVEVGT